MQETKYFSIPGSTSSKTKAWNYTAVSQSTLNDWISNNIPADATIDTAIISDVGCYKSATTATGTLEVTVGGTRALFAEKKITVSTHYPRIDVTDFINASRQISGDIVFRFFFYNTGSLTGTPKWTVLNGNLAITYTQTIECNITVTSSNESYGTVSGGGTFNDGTSVILTATPNTGYRVAYWMKDGVKVNNTHDIKQYTTVADNNHSFTAVFEPITYTIKFDSNGATGGSTDNIIATYNVSYYLPNCGFEKTNHHFLGWSTSSEPESTVYAVGTEIKNLCDYNNDIYTYYAQWSPNAFSIRYNSNNGADNEFKLSEVMFGNITYIPIASNTFERKGYTFGSWNDNPDGSGRGYLPHTEILNVWTVEHNEVVDFYAQWNPNSYTIRFDGNGGIGSMSDLSMVYEIPDNLPANSFTKAGHTFNGWNTKQDGSGDHFNDGASVINLATSGVITLYAEWEPIKYTITWKDWDGSELEQKEWDYGSYPSYSGNTDSLSYETDEAFYDFDGWIPNISLVSGNMTYTATYLKTIKTYTVTWVDWDGRELEVDTNVLYGDIPVFNYTKTPHKEPDDQYYYEFNNNWDIAIAPVTGNITYTAVYTKNIYYTVIWKDWNGDVLETDKVMYDTPPSYDREDPTRESTKSHEYKFLGWKTEISDEYVDEDDLDVVRADITYIAVYEEIERMYSFSVNILPSAECGRVEGYTDSEYKYGSELNLTAIPSDGYQFVSWSYTVNGVAQTAMKDTLEISIFEDTVVTAIFEERAGLPTMINETQVEAAYVNPDALTITYVISGDQIESTIQNDIVTSVDGWSFVISNEIPETGYKVDNIYIDDVQIY